MDATYVTLISQVGFPIFTALYFMIRMETHLKESNKLLTLLVERLESDANK